MVKKEESGITSYVIYVFAAFITVAFYLRKNKKKKSTDNIGNQDDNNDNISL